MNCPAVRERLAGHAMSVLDAREVAAVERHLQWCAGCRKEAAELGQAAATFAFALAPASPPANLEDRVVEAVQKEAVKSSGGPRRTARTAAALAVAAMVAVGSLGWGAVMAGRADRAEVLAAQAERRQETALKQFQRVLSSLPFEVPAEDTWLGRLAPTPGGRGGGAALVLVSPSTIDFSIVIVNGLDPKDVAALPYRVSLRNADGVTLAAGKISKLDAGGGGQVFHQFNRDLASFTKVIVTNASGDVVLEGAVSPETSLAGS